MLGILKVTMVSFLMRLILSLLHPVIVTDFACCFHRHCVLVLVNTCVLLIDKSSCVCA